MTATAGAFIASTFVATDEAEAADHKVKSGDSLWSIAQKYNTSVSQLKKLNDLNGDIIFPNQVIITEKKSSSTNNSKQQSSSNDSSTYTVKRGDTLSGIASKHNISLSNLMKWNDLDTTLIYPGNELVVSKSGSGSSGNNNNKDESNSNSGSNGKVGSAKVYTVKSGDTLSGIASRHDVTVANLRKWNNLKSDLILIGQKLNIGAKGDSGSSSTEKPSADVSYNVDRLISSAKNMLGIDYVWGGSTPSGFDCSGFIYYTYQKAGMSIGRLSSGGYYNRAYYVNNPQVGDLVFFEGTYKAGISHLGIYLGNNQFIHAGSNGVEISSLSNSYWKKHFDGYKRFY